MSIASICRSALPSASYERFASAVQLEEGFTSHMFHPGGFSGKVIKVPGDKALKCFAPSAQCTSRASPPRSGKASRYPVRYRLQRTSIFQRLESSQAGISTILKHTRSPGSLMRRASLDRVVVDRPKDRKLPLPAVPMKPVVSAQR